MTRIEQLRRIREQGQYEKMEGYLMDVTTALMLIGVYNALDRPGGLFEENPERREAFDRIPLARLVDFGWKNTTVGGAA